MWPCSTEYTQPEGTTPNKVIQIQEMGYVGFHEFLAEEKFLKIHQVSITDFGWNDNENIHISACT